MEKNTALHLETVKKLLSYMKEDWKKMLFVTLCILISAIASAASSLFIQQLIDDYITPLLKSSHPIYTSLIHALFTLAFVYLAGVLATWFYNRTMVTIAQGTLKRIRDDMFVHMQKLPIRYFDRHTHGEIMSFYTNDTDTLRQMIAQSLSQLISSLFTIIAVFVCMLYISVTLSLVVCVIMFVILKIVKQVTGMISHYSFAQQTSLASLDGYIEEMINGEKVVKVFNYEKRSRQELKKRNRDWAQNTMKATGMSNAIMPMMNALGYVQYIVVAIVGGYMAIGHITNLSLIGTNTLTLGMIASFLTLSRSFTNPISQISNQFNAIIIALAGAKRIFNFMDEEIEEDHGYVTLTKKEDGYYWCHPHQNGEVTYTPLKGDIVLNHVDFAYEKGKTVLHDITLEAKAGKKIAFVGATGAGKTTITNLINRFYDIEDGKIRYDGININKICKPDLRQSLGTVLQEVVLFTGTVMDNIRYGRLDASDEECIEAAKLVHADGFIRMLPKGYQTVLKGDGSGLSQGQRQLLSIARVAVANPPVMVLDEATSSIDTRSEALVQKGMDALMKGRTVFVIAHRLSTVKNADQIIVLDHGKIIESGTHNELISRKSVYYSLYTGAFELE